MCKKENLQKNNNNSCKNKNQKKIQQNNKNKRVDTIIYMKMNMKS